MQSTKSKTKNKKPESASTSTQTAATTKTMTKEESTTKNEPKEGEPVIDCHSVALLNNNYGLSCTAGHNLLQGGDGTTNNKAKTTMTLRQWNFTNVDGQEYKVERVKGLLAATYSVTNVQSGKKLLKSKTIKR